MTGGRSATLKKFQSGQLVTLHLLPNEQQQSLHAASLLTSSYSNHTPPLPLPLPDSFTFA